MNQNTLLRRAVLLAFLAALSIVTLWEASVCAQQGQFQSEPVEGILVRRGGAVIQGKISQQGDRYVVVVNGGQVFVKADQVEACCSTIQEAYQFLRQTSPHESAQDHIKMAQWCQRNHLLDEALEELNEARRDDPTHPMLPLLQRAIETERRGVAARPAVASPKENQVAPEELDRLVRNMPPGTVESFTQVIQPLLMNNCTTSGCHTANSAGTLTLTRVPSAGSRRITQRNLHAVLQWVNQDDPAASPLLSVPIRAHGTTKTPIFSDRQVMQYQELVDWVYRVAQSPSPNGSVMQASHRQPARAKPRVPAAVHTAPAGQKGGEVQTLGEMPGDAVDETGDHAPRPQAQMIEGPWQASPSAPTGPGNERVGVKRGMLPQQFVPADPFDPQAFNRQFFPAESHPANGEPVQ